MRTLLASALLLALMAPAAAQQAMPQVPSVNTDDVFPIIPHGTAKAQNDYVNAQVLSNFVGSTTSFVATGGETAATLADRASFKGVSFDVRSDWGLACDGVTDDSAKFSFMVALLNTSNAQATRLIFPGTCLIQWSNYTFSNAVNLYGLSGGGIKIAAGPLNGSLLTWTTAGAIYVNGFTLDFNHNATAGFTIGLNFNNSSINAYVDGSSFLNGGANPSSSNSYAMIQSNAFNEVSVTNSKFTWDTPTDNNHHKSINLGCATASICGGEVRITDNDALNSGFGVFNITGPFIAERNTVNGLAYGAGIAFEPPFTHPDDTVKKCLISNNVLMNTAAAPDVLGTVLAGIEVGNSGCIISHNFTYNTCGEGIKNGGSNLVVGNTMMDWGTCNSGALGNSAISSRGNSFQAGSDNSSYYGDNYSANDGAIPGATTQYGYSDGNNVVSSQLGTNDLYGSLGTYHISGGSHFASTGRVTLGQDRVPMIVPSSGSMGNNGALTLTTALDQTYPAAYFYVPAGAISSGSALGFYYGVMSSANAVTLYNNLYISGTPNIPTSPTVFVTTGPGAYTQATGANIGAWTYNLKGNQLGPNEEIQAHGVITCNNSAGAKTFNLTYGTLFFVTIAPTTSAIQSFQGGFQNDGVTNRQTLTATSNGQLANGVAIPANGAVDSTATQALKALLKLATDTDYVILQSLTVEQIHAPLN